MSSKVVDFPKFKNSKTLAEDIEKLRNKGEITYIEAVLEYCDIHSLEPDYIGSLIRSIPKLKQKLNTDAQTFNFLK